MAGNLRTTNPLCFVNRGMDYTILYKQKFHLDELSSIPPSWDLFISAFNASERVQAVFDNVPARTKHWLVHPEYTYKPDELPTTNPVFAPHSRNEAEWTQEYVASLQLDWRSIQICVDITGFMRPQLMFFLAWLFNNGVTKLDALYTDPVKYVKEEDTTFTEGPVVEVRQVAGFEGVHVPDPRTTDLLIIGTGYDNSLISHVADSKDRAHKVQLFGLPSLQADFYQENVLQAAKAAESIGHYLDDEALFAPANDPFVTAQVLHNEVKRQREEGVQNVYLSPLGTKPQVLGFALFYLTECVGTATSIIFPFAERYTRETTKGVSRIWRYTIELLNPHLTL